MSEAGTGRAARRIAALPVPVRIGVLYLAARAVTTLLLWLAAALSGPGSRFGEDATVGALSMGWDAQWYWLVGTQGYPSELPLDGNGHVTQNAWAFMPLYPALSRALSVLTGSYPAAAITVALLAGYAASLVLFALLRARIGDSAATWAVALFASGPLSVVFQMGYAESLFLLWLFLALWALTRRRYGWLYLLIPLMAYTRPGVLAFSLMLAGYGIHRWVIRRRRPLPAREIVHIVLAGLWAAVLGMSWTWIAALATGQAHAYFETELSWRRMWTGAYGEGFVPFSGVWEAVAIWSRVWGIPPLIGYLGLGMLVLLAAWMLFSRPVRALGVEIRLWSASYLLYLLVVFFPQSSTFRLLLPLSPLYGALALPASLRWRFSMLGAGVVLQWWWIYEMLAQGNTFWQVP